jgi:hypothetical protein
MSVLRRHLTLATTGAILLTLGTATAASGSTMSITVGPEPTESITTQLGVTGIVTTPRSNVELKVQPAGGEQCGANFSADGGTTVIQPGFFTSYLEAGTYSEAGNWTFESAGSYLLCGWMRETVEGEGLFGSGEVVASAKLLITVRPPHITLSISAPASVAPSTTFQIATTARAETSRKVYEYIEPQTGRGCPANAAAAASTAGSTLINWPAAGSPWQVDGGPFTETVNETASGAGVLLVCAYAEYPTAESAPEAVASSAISVMKPQAVCVVPKLKGRTLAQADKRP